jgi:hypothetical protein
LPSSVSIAQLDGSRESRIVIIFTLIPIPLKTFISTACLLAAFAITAAAEPETTPAAEPAKPAADPVKEAATRAKVTTTVTNLKMLSIALIEFDTDYGAYPDDETAQDVSDATGTKLTFKGGTSNAYFRQLLASVARSEKIFQIGGAKVPDDDFKDDSKALAKGECGFAYIPGLSMSGEPGTPVAFAPMVPGKLEFDPVPLGGKAVVLRLDGSVSAQAITPDGKVVTPDGKSIFDPAQPYWKGKAPKVAWPE